MTTGGRELDIDALADSVRGGDRASLARAITLVESTRDDHGDLAQALLERLLPATGGAVRVGITGVPGAGKSTLIDALGRQLLDAGHRVAVLAVDPSSTVTGGSVLGDKTRMEALARDPRAFVRPSPGGDAAGGVARRTREAGLLCEAAGYDVLLIETIGVGQSELTVAQLVDTFVVLTLAGAGDELQGIKRGLMELADVVVVHKADGDNRDRCERAAAEQRMAQKVLHHSAPGYEPPVVLASALDGVGLEELWRAVEAHRTALGDDGIAEKRARQASYWFEQTVLELLLRAFYRDAAVLAALPELREAVVQGTMQPTAAARALLARKARADGP